MNRFTRIIKLLLLAALVFVGAMVNAQTTTRDEKKSVDVEALDTLSGDELARRMEMNVNKVNKYVETVNKKANEFNGKAEKYSDKMLNRLIRQEKKMQRKMMKVDTLLAKSLFAYSIDSLKKFQQILKSKEEKINRILGGEYFSYLDTAKSSLRFLQDASKLMNSGGELKEKLSSSIGKFNELENKLTDIDKLQQFLSMRKEVLKSQLQSLPELSKYIKNISKETYYLNEKVIELKSVIADPSKIENVVIEVLRKLPAFQDFISRNSQLAGLFAQGSASPMLSAGMPIVNGLPPRSAIQQIIQTSFGGSPTNITSLLNEQVGQAGSALSKIQNKINAAGGMGDKEMPDFKPNSQRVKSFKKRLEYGADLQFAKSTYLLPASGDIALQMGYKLNDKSSLGIGGAYKFGMGTGWNDIRFGSMGVGLRTYMNWKIKGGFYMQGGSEWNYNTAFKNIDQLKNISLWQQSALLGISKKYQVSKKLKGNVQVLYDFLNKQHIPYTQPILFRFGCNF